MEQEHETQPDAMRIAVRGLVVPDARALQRRRANRHARASARDASPSPAATPDPPELAALVHILGPQPWFTLTFDTETTKDARLRLRVGYYEVRGISFTRAVTRYREGRLTPDDRHRLIEAAFILPPFHQFPTDPDTVQEYAHEHSGREGYRNIPVRTDREFVDRFYYWAKERGAWVAGHNILFDLTRFLTSCGPGSKQFRGGFWLKLCDCANRRCVQHPPIRYKSLGRYKARYAFLTTTLPNAPDGTRRTFRRKLRIVDTVTLGFALAHPQSAQLKSMGQAFGARVIKGDAPDFAGPITPVYLHYLQRDVLATYWLFVAEMSAYALHGITRSPERLFSEASLGKGYLHDLRVPTATERPWSLPTNEQGYAQSTYYGGRSEVMLRQTPVEVIYCDFKSQYPTINTLMGLQAFWIAQDVRVQDVTDAIRSFVAQPIHELLRALQQPDTWRQLRVIVQVVPHDDLLPARALYNRSTYNIGQTHLTSRYPLWYTLADVLACRIRTGGVPTILRALEFIPSSEVVHTAPKTLFGRREVDLHTDDFFRAIINERGALKRSMKDAPTQAERDTLDAQQTGLKLLANATSYGVLVEMNERVYGGRPLRVAVHALDTAPRLANRVEEPGPYFLGAIGTLIPAGGRLLLALAEQLAADHNIPYAFCDTDSMAFARHEGMNREAFYARVAAIVEYFQPLYPYDDGGQLFEYEEQNFAIDPKNPNRILGDAREPLYFLGVSAKRYVLYNRLRDGSFRIRKLSSHGLGMWGRRDQEKHPPPEHVPPPHPYIEEKDADGDVTSCRFSSAPLGGPPWVYGLWYDAIWTLEHGRYPDGRTLRRSADTVRYRPPSTPLLDTPAFYSLTITTWADYERFRHLPEMVPGNFITVLPPARTSLVRIHWEPGELSKDGITEDDADDRDEAFIRGLAATPSARYTGYCATVEEVARATIYAVADGQALPADTPLTTMAEVVAGYFTHPEEKAANGREAGVLQRRHVEVTGVDAIGKESNRLAQASAEETSGVISGKEMLAGHVYGSTGTAVVAERRTPAPPLSSLLTFSAADLVAATCLSPMTIHSLLHAATEPTEETIAALAAGMRLLDPDNPQGIAGWRDVLPPHVLAGVLGVDEQTARVLHQGRRTWTETQRAQVMAAMASLHPSEEDI